MFFGHRLQVIAHFLVKNLLVAYFVTSLSSVFLSDFFWALLTIYDNFLSSLCVFTNIGLKLSNVGFKKVKTSLEFS